MSSGEEWGALIEKWAETSNLRLEHADRSLKIQMATSVIQRTPVGNPALWAKGSRPPPGYVGGRARNNWFASISSPSSKTTNRKSKSGAAAINKAKAVADQSVGSVFYLTNNLPYIRRLEYRSWSTQAPVGMVRITMREARNSLKRAIMEAKRIK